MEYEVNFDGIVGPTHNYSGLSYGNVASLAHKKAISNPKEAALQGLTKMKNLMDLGIKQAVLPPQERPHLNSLRLLGFIGSDKEILRSAYQQAPEILFACSSASSMWVANAATVSPSSDSLDGKLHITPANLSDKFHRSIESPITGEALKRIFADENYFVNHPCLPAGFADEGAANHTRFCYGFQGKGVQLFVYGKQAFDQTVKTRFPARQTEEASRAIARLHRLPSDRLVFAQQSPEAIDSGVFHNDVISVGHEHLFLFHEMAYLNTEQVLIELQQKFAACCHQQMILIPLAEKRVSLTEAVKSYFFNSQIVTLPDRSMELIAPVECQEVPAVKTFIDEMIHSKQNPINRVHYFNLRESMRNGGGPACLRLRIVMNENEIKAANQAVFLTEALYQKLVDWIHRHYRDRLVPDDLADPQLLIEGRQALDELSQLLHLGALYDFQQ